MICVCFSLTYLLLFVFDMPVSYVIMIEFLLYVIMCTVSIILLSITVARC